MRLARFSSRSGWATACLCVAAASGQVQPGRVHNDPQGFTIRLLPGWQVNTVGQGILAQSADRRSFALVRPFFLENKTAAFQWLQQVPRTQASLLPQARIVRSAQRSRQPDEVIATLAYDAGGSPGHAAAVCSVSGRSGMLFLIGAPEEIYARDRMAMVAMLQSFRFTQPQGGGAAADALAGIGFVRMREPGENAFSLEVPRDWNTRLRVQRDPQNPIDARQLVDMISPDRQIWLTSGDPQIPVFTVPSQPLMQSGMGEGSRYGTTVVRRPRNAQQFLREYLPGKLANTCPGLRITEIRDLPQEAQVITEAQERLLGTRVQFSLGEVCFECSGPPAKRGYWLAGIGLVPTNFGGGTWQVTAIGGYLAPAERVAQANAIFAHAQRTYSVNPQWNRQQMADAQAIMEMNRKSAETFQDMAMKNYWNREASADRQQRRFVNMIGNYTDVRDPETGEEWKVSSGHNYYWRNRNEDHYNSIGGTQIDERPDVDLRRLVEF